MSKSKIMVVEDSGIVLLDIQKSLNALGYTVVATASSKDDAIRKADETRPDLVLMDIRLGENNGGIDAADHIRENFNIPIVFLTGYADEDTFQRAKVTNPFGYILKPFDPKGLHTTIEIALHNHDLKSKLRESEKRYRTLLETMNDGVAQADANGKLVYVNESLCQMIGFTRDELIGLEHTQLFVDEFQELQLNEFEKRKKGLSGSFETVLACKDGSRIPIILSGNPMIGDDGKFAGMIGVFTDITERKQAEDDVKRSKEALEEAEHQVHMGHYEIDAVTGKATWSEETFKIFGIDPKDGEPTTETYNELIHVDDRDKVNESYYESVKNEVLFDMVYRIIRSDGEIRYVHSSARTIKNDAGDTKMFGTLQDITQLKQVEFALQESEERYRTIFENSPIAIWEEDFSEVNNSFNKLRATGVTDFRDYFEQKPDEVSRLIRLVKIKNINQTSVSFFEASSKDDFSQNLSEYAIEDMHEVYRDELIVLAEGQTNFNAEFSILDLSGQNRTLFLDLAVAPASERKLDRVLVSFIDITERKQAENIMSARYRLVRKSLTESMPDLLQATLDEAEALTDSTIGFFHFIEADQINLSLQAWSTNTLQNMCSAEGEGLHYPIDQAGVWVDCIRERKPVIHNSYEALEHRKGLPEGHAEVKRELIVPVIRGDKIVAIIGVGNKELEYSRKDEDVVSLLADLAWDIVERKQTEAALRESEALYHDLVETAQDLIWQCDLEGRYVYLNPAWENVFGYKVEEMLGVPFVEFQNSEYAKRDENVHKRILHGEVVKSFETVHLGKDGREIYLVFNAKTIRDEQGNPIGTRGTAYDITERKRAELALKKSELLLKESQNIAHMGHYRLDFVSGFWESSDGLNELFGIDWDYKTDVDGWLNIVHPDDRDDMSAYFAEEIVKKHKEFDKEYRVVRVADEKTIWVLGLGRLEFDEDGNLIFMIGNIQDISERKQAERALRENEQRYRQMFETNQAVKLIIDPSDGKIVEANKAACKFYGYAYDVLTSLKIMDINTLSEEEVKREMENAKQQEKLYFNFRHALASGEIRDVEVYSGPIQHDDKVLLYSIVHDITERKQVELALRESAIRYRTVVETQNEFIVRWKPDGTRTFVNEAYLRYYNTTMDEALSTSFMSLIVEEDRSAVEEKMAKLMAGELSSATDVHRVIKADGSIGWQEWTDHAIYDEHRNIVEFQAVGRDITERRQAEEALRMRTAELEALFSISSHLRVAQSADEMLPLVLSELRRVLRSDANAVILLDLDKRHFTYALSDGVLAVNNGTQFEADSSISGWVMQTRQPYITENLSSDPRKTASILVDENLGPAIFVPVISESEFIGVLLCARKSGFDSQVYSSSDAQLLSAVGEMVGNAFRRATLYDQAMMRLQHVQTLHSIDMAISANLDLSVILDVLLTQGVMQLDADAASILLLNPHTHMLEFAAGNGFHTKEIRSARLRLGEGLPGQAAMDRKILYLSKLSDADDLVRKYLLDEGFISYQAAPLIAKGQLQGVLEIYNRRTIDLSDERVGFLETLATQAAIAIDNSQLFGDLQRSNFELEMAYDATIEGWSRALELRDQETEGHTLRVTDMTLRLAQAMGVRGSELIQIRRGALLHDIGKMGVPDRILLKPGQLDADEWKIMKQHTVYAFEMLWPIEFLRPAIDIPHCHHERWDGTGYPRQLKGEQIPLSARVFAIADVWDALTSDRPYRQAWTDERALEYITENSGKHFDPRVVEQFLIFLKSDSKNFFLTV